MKNNRIANASNEIILSTDSGCHFDACLPADFTIEYFHQCNAKKQKFKKMIHEFKVINNNNNIEKYHSMHNVLNQILNMKLNAHNVKVNMIEKNACVQKLLQGTNNAKNSLRHMFTNNDFNTCKTLLNNKINSKSNKIKNKNSMQHDNAKELLLQINSFSDWNSANEHDEINCDMFEYYHDDIQSSCNEYKIPFDYQECENLFLNSNVSITMCEINACLKCKGHVDDGRCINNNDNSAIFKYSHVVDKHLAMCLKTDKYLIEEILLDLTDEFSRYWQHAFELN